MNSKRRHEGYLMVDHRAGAGLGPRGTPFGPGTLFEAPVITCSHCQRGVIINPARTRARAYCPKCDHYICDECEGVRVASGGDCRTFNQIVEEYQNAVVAAEQGSR